MASKSVTALVFSWVLVLMGMISACSSDSGSGRKDSGGAAQIDAGSTLSGTGGRLGIGGSVGTGGVVVGQAGTGGAVVGGRDGGSGTDANLSGIGGGFIGLGGMATGGAVATGGRTRRGTGGSGGVAMGGRVGTGGQGGGGSTAPGGTIGTGGQIGAGGTATGGQVGSGGGTGTGGSGGAPTGLWIIGSHPDYQWSDVPPTQVPWSHLTHMVLAFLEPTGSNGSYALDVTGYGPSTLSAWKTAAQGYITAAHAAGVKVICSLGGEALGGAVFTEATGTVAKSDALAGTITSILGGMGFDGVDIDWEESYSATGVVRLVHSLRAAWPTGIITTSVGPTYGDEQVEIDRTLAAAKDDVDAFMIMLYIPGDQTWTWWVVPIPLTPLHGTPTPFGETQPYSADRELEVWTSVGVPASKLILGVGGFGLAWVDSNNDQIAPVAPYANYEALSNDPTCSAPPWTCAAPADTEKAPSRCSDNHVTQKWVDEVVAASNGALQLKTDTVGEVTYWAAPATNQLVTVASPCGSGTVDVGLIFYETPASMTSKVSYCNTKGMRGMEFWTMGQMVDASGHYPILETVKP
jgi:GH18 family chitinase